MVTKLENEHTEMIFGIAMNSSGNSLASVGKDG